MKVVLLKLFIDNLSVYGARKLWVAAQRAGPVSYTHLRAHETVLDLVCRLLLEKKTA